MKGVNEVNYIQRNTPNEGGKMYKEGKIHAKSFSEGRICLTKKALSKRSYMQEGERRGKYMGKSRSERNKSSEKPQ